MADQPHPMISRLSSLLLTWHTSDYLDTLSVAWNLLSSDLHFGSHPMWLFRSFDPVHIGSIHWITFHVTFDRLILISNPLIRRTLSHDKPIQIDKWIILCIDRPSYLFGWPEDPIDQIPILVDRSSWLNLTMTESIKVEFLLSS